LVLAVIALDVGPYGQAFGSSVALLLFNTTIEIWKKFVGILQRFEEYAKTQALSYFI